MNRALFGVVARRFIIFIIALGTALSVLTARPASAQDKAEPNPGEVPVDVKANAETLFNRGKELLDGGNFKEACPLLAESLRLDFGLGTLLYLSHCQEQVGQTASAWAGFKEAAEIARKKGETSREESARQRADALEPKLAKLRIVVDDANKAIGIVVKRNGVAVGQPAWGEPLPVDPGVQMLEAEAPGYKSWSTTIDIPVGPGESETKIPALVKGPDDGVTVRSSGPGIDGKAMRIAGLAIGGAGIAGILVGAGFGIHAIVRYNEAVDTCVDGDPDRCTPTGVRMQKEASSSALVSTVAISVGAGALGAGVLLFFLAPSDEPAPKVGAWIDSRGFFLSFGGAL